ncbi:tRNA 2-thiouridine(34) synthase MnmA [Candidatus Kaiserbacteria bacterium RIFCSPHIGHO2_01_FULL_50_13]|uniref:tRNA-specific 2-thiouridylase MnmA n=1 Tax=Candidatus Kaiserbacteria bacterium RIFCSPLOWO2_01_FULL_50_24 TaxID=1798507 RepID=A0A1F6EMS6_9BACT|nr:MAG: tRNA 2-thiouridine(34) synthase MnmA [Candidatus Kaiserbacteria bacterium RIFCSPHIGHO2_01_FULL_50_13]OGG74930.1 MAG: tRNA 2-thiouridine(34) synthase MnmA [Candidatus Kaiserbacteria bacterium RIFCSPLOWO2_01_FULL_50_24]
MASQASTVYVGLSGGVDSAVSAALLKERGFTVVGVFIKIWQPEFIECTWERDRLDAMRVAAHLNIPFREIDLSAEYKRHVINEMIAGYTRGETPNPDTLCNERIKFGSFFNWARTEGADFVATGHYAQIMQKSKIKNQNDNIKSKNQHRLIRSKDKEKDQSYFLYALTQENLAHILFPVGGMTKREVRRAAERLRLPVAKKQDSQGLCFVGDVSMREFLSRYIAIERGDVVDLDGRVVGEHEGAALYTIGQRHGFSHEKQTALPHYVVSVDTVQNIVRVSPRREDATVSAITVGDIHWISGSDDTTRVKAVQIRYREVASPCRTLTQETCVSVEIIEPRVAAPGQAAVFFNGEECLGGGIIHT